MPPTSRQLPSLGDVEKRDLVLTRSEVELPATRREIVAAFESILNQGGVQKVVVEIGRPISVSRLVDRESALAPPELPPDDFWNQVRNGRMEEMTLFEKRDGFYHLFAAFSLVTIRKLRPRMLFCHDVAGVRSWLNLPDNHPMDWVFGIELTAKQDVPDDAVILAATPYDETDVQNTLGIRIPVDVQIATVTALPKKGKS